MSKNMYSGVKGITLENTVNQGSNRSLESLFYMTTEKTSLLKRPVNIGYKIGTCSILYHAIENAANQNPEKPL